MSCKVDIIKFLKRHAAKRNKKTVIHFSVLQPDGDGTRNVI